MNHIPQFTPPNLSVTIDQEIARLMQLRLPSLRIIHNARSSIVRLNYERHRDEPLVLKSGNGRKVHPGHAEIAMSWIEMLGTAVQPAQVMEVKAKIVPTKQPLRLQPAAHLAATVLAVSAWPLNIPWPEGANLYAAMKVRIRHEKDEPLIDLFFDIGAVGEPPESLRAIEHLMPSLTEYLAYYWRRCCGVIVPWLIDGGITDLCLLVPIRPSDVPSDGVTVPGSFAIH